MKFRINLSPKTIEILGTGFFIAAMSCALVDCFNVGFQLHWHMMWQRIFYVTVFVVFFYSWGKTSVIDQRERNREIDEARRQYFKKQFEKEYKQFREEMHGK